jgi:hypothetical protein
MRQGEDGRGEGEGEDGRREGEDEWREGEDERKERKDGRRKGDVGRRVEKGDGRAGSLNIHEINIQFEYRQPNSFFCTANIQV